MRASSWRPLRGTAFLAAAAAFTGGSTAAQELTYNGSFSYSTGSYFFVDRTHSLWLSNGLTLRAGPATLSAALPIIAQNSGVVSFVAGQPLPTGGEQSGAVGGRSRGERIGSRGSAGQSASVDSTVVFRDEYEIELGDPLFSASVEAYSGTGVLKSLSVVGAAKAPFRTLESGVGTGQWDFGGGASLVVGSGLTLLFADVTYWSFGDLPDLELEGSLLYSVGVSRAVMDARLSILASLSGGTAIMETVDAPLTAGLVVLYSFGGGKTLSAGGSAGLSESSPDFSAYLAWGLRL
ncbi:MAG TPA: hypothetical protein VLA09_03040 [Longimicrobiales bacterium]|nr:hypothetical protein [Longimicrobiales bacterium]